MKDFFAKNKKHIESLMVEIQVSERKFMSFRDELSVFREDLKEYYGFFVKQCEKIMVKIDEMQVFNNRETSGLKQRMTILSHE